MNLNGWISMGGHAPYVWGAVAVCLGVMAAEVAALRARTRAALRALGASHADAGGVLQGGAA